MKISLEYNFKLLWLFPYEESQGMAMIVISFLSGLNSLWITFGFYINCELLLVSTSME